MSVRSIIATGVMTVFAMIAVPAAPLAAQANITVTVQMPVGDVFALAISPISTPLPVPTWADFSAGFTNVPTPVALTARANRSYKVTISAAAPTFTYTGTLPNPGKPRTDLQWALTSGGAYTGISTGATVMSGATAHNGAAQLVYYRTLWNIAQAPPGAYSLAVSFTISAP